MEFKSKQHKCKFTIPEKITVRQQLEYFSAIGGVWDKNTLTRWWIGATQLIQAWECKTMPDFNVDIDEVSDPAITDIIVWAGTAVRGHINSLDEIPKNS